MNFVKTKGIVLREIKTGEADKLLVFLTLEFGKITVLAPGARRTRSKFVGCTQWLCYSEIYLYKTKENYRLNDGSIIEPFYELRDDLDKLYVATFFCNVIKDVVMEGGDSKEELKLLLNSLYYISKEQKDIELITSIFRFRILLSIGMAPLVKVCAGCSFSFELKQNNIKNQNKKYFFDFVKCAVFCECCENQKPGKNLVEILPGTFHFIKHVVESKWENLFKFDVSKEVKNEANQVSERFLNERIEKDYKIG